MALPLQLAPGSYLRLSYEGPVDVSGTATQEWDLTALPPAVREDPLFRESFLIFARPLSAGLTDVSPDVSFLPAVGLPETLVLTLTASDVADEIDLDVWFLHSILGASGFESRLYFLGGSGGGGTSTVTLFATHFDVAPGITTPAIPSYSEGAAIPVDAWLFEDSGDEFIYGECPSSGYVSGDIPVVLGGQPVGGAPGDTVRLGVSFAVVAPGNDPATVVLSAVVYVELVSTGAGERIVGSVSVTPPALNAGDLLVMRIERTPGADTLADDFALTDVSVF